jgi:hypothetical protein
MLAKEPGDRYQTPKEVLKALVRGEEEAPPREEVLQSLADLEMAETLKEKRSPHAPTPDAIPIASERRAGPAPRPNPVGRVTREEEPPPAQPSKGLPNLVLLGAAVVLALAILIVLLVLAGEIKEEEQRKDPGEKNNTPTAPSEPPDKAGGIVSPGAIACRGEQKALAQRRRDAEARGEDEGVTTAVLLLSG